MKRKFSFDIPKLKFGPSKQETQALKQHLAARQDFDEEPATPKSVRPPLPTAVEAELRAACTWVVVNYRPSPVPHHPAAGVGVSRQQTAHHVDYAAINAQVRRELGGGDVPATVLWPSIPAEEEQTGIQWPSIPPEGARVEQNGSQWPSSDMFRYKPTETSTDLFHQGEFEAMRKQRSSIMAKADELMANLEETQKVLITPELRSHVRNASNESALSLHVQEAPATLRSDSAGTVISTPRTDVTGREWAGSTNPTTAYVTPATQSKRTSHMQSDPHLPPKVTPVDAEWMRLELERHLQAQEDEMTRKESPVNATAAGLAESTTAPIAESPASPTTLQRKAVPRRGTGESQNFSKPADTMLNQSQLRAVSHPVSMPTSPSERPANERPSTSEWMSTNNSKRASRAITTTHDVPIPRRPSTAHTTTQAETGAQATRSRAQSTRSQFQNFSRPSLDVASRRRSPGPDISRCESRARSVDSFRSAVSSISSSAESSARQWRNSLGRRRSLDSDISAASIGTRVSEASRGRPRMPRHSPPPPPINLDRELPPLPALEEWKPVKAEVASSTYRQRVTRGEDDLEAAADEPALPQRRDSLVNRRSTQPAPLPTPASPLSPNLQARHTIYFDAMPSPSFDKPLAPTNTRDPAVGPGLSTHRRSINVLEASSPSFIHSMSQVSPRAPSPGPSPRTRPLNPTTNPTPAADKRHSRNFSSGAEAPNFSRKLSSDDYSRMYDSRYQNMLEVTPPLHGDGGGSGDRGVAEEKPRSKSKGKRHWWQGKVKRDETWMDAVVKSGSRSGVLLTDGVVAGAPIVRY